VRFFFDLQQGVFVSGLGSNVPGSLVADFRRRDAESVEVQFISGQQGSATAVQLPGTAEIRFGGKALTRYGDDLIVSAADFAWWPTEQCYVARPSFGTLQLSAMFLGTEGVSLSQQSGAAYTLQAGDLSKLVVLAHDDAATLTIPTGLGADGALLYVMAGDVGAVTVVGAVGVTLTGSVLLASGQRVLQLTRTAANVWSASIPTERAVVDLMGELTWRDLAAPTLWRSTPQFVLRVSNDVIRGDEGAPTDPNEITDLVTRSELTASLAGAVLVSSQTLTTLQKTQARTNIDAAQQSALAALDTELDTLTTEVATKATTAALTAASATAASATAAVDARVTTLDGVVIKKVVQVISDPDIDIVRANLKLPLLSAGGSGTSLAHRSPLLWTAASGSTTPTLLGISPTVLAGTATARSIDLLDAGRTVTYTSTSTINLTAHGLAAGTPVQMAAGAGGALATGYTAGTWYYVSVLTANTLQLLDSTGTTVSRTNSGTGTQLLKLQLADSWSLQRVRRMAYVSAATANSMAGMRHGRMEWARSTIPQLGGWTMEARIGIGDAADVADARLFVGMSALTPAWAGTTSIASLRDAIGLCSNTSGVGANLRLYSVAGTSTGTTVDLGSNFPHTRGTMYRVKLVHDVATGNVSYEVARLGTAHIATGTITAQLPRTHALLTPTLWRSNGSTALAVALDIAELSVTPLE